MKTLKGHLPTQINKHKGYSHTETCPIHLPLTTKTNQQIHHLTLLEKNKGYKVAMPLSLIAFKSLYICPSIGTSTFDLHVHIELWLHSIHCALELENRHWTGRWPASKRNSKVNIDRDYKAQGQGNRGKDNQLPQWIRKDHSRCAWADLTGRRKNAQKSQHQSNSNEDPQHTK